MPNLLCVSDEWSLGFNDLRGLADMGFNVVTATNGYEAVQLFSFRTIDAVVVNRKLPDLGVGTLARFCKAHKPGIPVIMLANVMPPPEERINEIDAVIAKTHAGGLLAPTLELLMSTAGIDEEGGELQAPAA